MNDENISVKKILLAIDCGTQSVRTILFNSCGEIIAKEKIEYKPYTSLFPGWAEQDPELLWNAVVTGCCTLKEKHAEAFGQIAGVGVTTQRDTIVLIDESGKPLRPAITWLDTRAAKGSYRANICMKAIYKIMNVCEKIYKMQASGKINWIRENEKEIWNAAWKVLMVSGFFNFRLTGKPADASSSLVGHIPFDHKKRKWAAKGNIVSKIFPMEHSKCCEVFESGAIIGTITKKASQETGITQGVPVIACGSDKACETIGMGVIDTSKASLSFGTTATVEVCAQKYFEPVPFMPAYCAALPSSWVSEIEIFRGYWMISWFRDELGYEERCQATSTGIIPEKLLDRLLDASPAGGYGLMLQPYWGASLKEHFAKGAIIGFGDVHGKHAIYRAIIEGLAYSLREGLETLERRGKFTCEKIVASGGAAQSDRVCQITADILNKPIIRGVTTETSALGAALITAVGIGIHSDTKAAIEKMIRYEKVFTPNPKHRKIYDDLYGVYKKLYPALSKIYAEIRDVTGYPEK